MEVMRINRFLARSGLGSRRKVEQFIKDGLISVNGEMISDLFCRVSMNDVVEYQGRRLQIPEKHRYIALNKPRDVVTSRKTGRNEKGVFEFFNDTSNGLLYAGRLDKMSRGLLLFSDDGHFIQRMTHPAHKVARFYELKLKAFLSVDISAVKNSFLNGIEDDGELLIAQSVDLRPQGSNIFIMNVVLQSGRKRQLRRMCDQVGLEVVDLCRYGIGDLRIENMNIESGQWRELTTEELASIS